MTTESAGPSEAARQTAEEFWKSSAYWSDRMDEKQAWEFAEAYADAALAAERERSRKLLEVMKIASPYIEFYAPREMNSPSNNEEAVRDTREMLMKFRAAIAEAEKG